MRSDNLNWYNHGSYTEMTYPSSNVNVTNENESKRSIVNEKLAQSCYTNKNKSKRSIVKQTFIAELFRGRGKTNFYGAGQI